MFCDSEVLAKVVTDLDVNCHVADLSNWKEDLMRLMKAKFNEYQKNQMKKRSNECYG